MVSKVKAQQIKDNARETVTVDHETQQPTLTDINQQKKALPEYKKLGVRLFATVQDGQNKLRNVLLAIFDEVGKTDIDGYKLIAESYAEGYTNPLTKKNMKSSLFAIFKAYVKDSEALLNGKAFGEGEAEQSFIAGIKDKSTQITHWQKLARLINGKTQAGGNKKSELTTGEVDNMVDKIDQFASIKDSEAIISTASAKLNGEARMALIVNLIAAMIDDEHAEEPLKAWAKAQYFDAEALLQRIYDAKQQAKSTTEAVKNNVAIAA